MVIVKVDNLKFKRAIYKTNFEKIDFPVIFVCALSLSPLVIFSIKFTLILRLFRQVSLWPGACDTENPENCDLQDSLSRKIFVRRFSGYYSIIGFTCLYFQLLLCVILSGGAFGVQRYEILNQKNKLLYEYLTKIFESKWKK